MKASVSDDDSDDDTMTTMMMMRMKATTIDLFLVRFVFNFSVCPVWWTKLATRQLFTAQ